MQFRTQRGNLLTAVERKTGLTLATGLPTVAENPDDMEARSLALFGACFAGGALAGVFLVGQLAAWQQMVGLGYFASSNPANAFFYLITGLHGLHLLGGLVAWGRTMSRLGRGDEIARLGASAELCAIYWHFLLAVWLVLFGLMLFT